MISSYIGFFQYQKNLERSSPSFSEGKKSAASTTPREKLYVLLGDCNRSFANTSSFIVLIPKYDTHRHKFWAKPKKKLLNSLEILNTLKPVIGICNDCKQVTCKDRRLNENLETRIMLGNWDSLSQALLPLVCPRGLTLDIHCAFCIMV